MRVPRRRIPAALSLVLGLALGAILATVSSRPVVQAHGGDRSGESILTSGPVLVQYHEGMKVQIPQDALYYLDYKVGRLLATIPSFQQSAGPAKMLDNFAERDLVADFKIDLDLGPRPHFLMTTGSLGAYNEGWAPLFVFESTTNQVAVYRIQQQIIGTVSQPRFELVELRSIGRTASPPGP